jgi:hypothetical protein
MRATIKSLICGAIVLSTLCLCGRAARAESGAEEATEWAAQLAQQQQERQDWLNSIMQHAADVSQYGSSSSSQSS